MKQRKPMSRGKGFARPVLERKPRPPLVLSAEPSRAVLRRADGNARMVVMPKSEPVRCEKYLRLVAKLPCCFCGVSGYGQAAHANTGKGLAIKADDRTAFSLCADRPGVRGCHSLFDQGALLDKQQRRNFEDEMGRETRERIKTMGLWPASLPELPGDEQGESNVRMV